MIENVRKRVYELMNGDDSGHGFDHVERVWLLAKKLTLHSKADKNIVELAALLHDVDDYKLVGQEKADSLFNARKIMTECGVAPMMAEQVCEIIAQMGYSKLLAGIRPQTLEGQIVSDADMLDAVGVNGIIRCLSFALTRCQKYGTPIFDEKIWPELHLSATEYKKPDRKSDNFINHFFEKLLRLHKLMLTEEGKKAATERQESMILFLRAFFKENNAPEWNGFLDRYLADEKLK